MMPVSHQVGHEVNLVPFGSICPRQMPLMLFLSQHLCLYQHNLHLVGWLVGSCCSVSWGTTIKMMISDPDTCLMETHPAVAAAAAGQHGA